MNRIYLVRTTFGRELFLAFPKFPLGNEADLAPAVIRHLMRDERIETIAVLREQGDNEALLLERAGAEKP